MENVQSRRCNGVLTTIKRICGSFHIDTLNPQIAAIEEVLRESDVINVALLGRFKAGKSSFLNSVIGKDIVPVGILPLTATVTRIRYGPNDKAEVSFLNGQVQSVSFDELSEFIAEERNPENVKKVARADLELSSLKNYSGVQFVDTPGLGSVYRHNTATSKDWLPRVGAAFLMISIDHPLSEDDIALLKELESHTPEVHILLTKVDLVPGEEVQRVVSFIETQIQKKLGKSLRVFTFSNRPGFDTYRAAVFKSIQSMSINHLEKTREIIDYKLHSVISQCLEYLKLAVSAAASTEESRAMLRRQLLLERESLSVIQNELQVIGTSIKGRLWNVSYEKFKAQFSRLRLEITEELAKAMSSWEGNIAITCRTFWSWLRESLDEHLENLLDEFGPQVSSSYLNEALTSFTRIARGFQDRLAQDIKKSIQTEFKVANFQVQIEKPKEIDLHLYDLTMSLSSEVWSFLPARWARFLLRRRFISQINIEVEKNLSRLSVQWLETVSAAIDGMASQALNFIKNEIAVVENILTESPDRRTDIEKSMRELDVLATHLSKARPDDGLPGISS